MKTTTIIYQNVTTGEITENRKQAIKEFFNKGFDIHILDPENKILIAKIEHFTF